MIAEEIVRQLGGRRFILMTGAYDFVTLDSGVRFKLPNGVIVEILLEPTDTYRVRFLKATGEVISEYEDIYNDQLQELFTRETGLKTHL